VVIVIPTTYRAEKLGSYATDDVIADIPLPNETEPRPLFQSAMSWRSLAGALMNCELYTQAAEKG